RRLRWYPRDAGHLEVDRRVVRDRTHRAADADTSIDNPSRSERYQRARIADRSRYQRRLSTCNNYVPWLRANLSDEGPSADQSANPANHKPAPPEPLPD